MRDWLSCFFFFRCRKREKKRADSVVRKSCRVFFFNRKLCWVQYVLDRVLFVRATSNALGLWYLVYRVVRTTCDITMAVAAASCAVVLVCVCVCVCVFFHSSPICLRTFFGLSAKILRAVLLYFFAGLSCHSLFSRLLIIGGCGIICMIQGPFATKKRSRSPNHFSAMLQSAALSFPPLHPPPPPLLHFGTP